MFDFKSHKGELNYDWNVNVNSNEIDGNNEESKYIIRFGRLFGLASNCN